MQNSIIFWPLSTQFLPMQLMLQLSMCVTLTKMTETNYSITIHGAKNRSLQCII